jgi:L-ascorbate metabolism protein UlaG (beta-lactamase superfamily)
LVVRLIRHATLRVEIAGRILLVDPMLDDADARPAIAGTENDRRNPLVSLPAPAAEVVAGIDAVLVTHLHADHFDDAAVAALGPAVPIYCQPEDEQTLLGRGFADVRPVEVTADFDGITITRTHAQHGTGEIGERMAPASGFVIAADGEPTLYVAGDSIWCDDVARAIARHEPVVTVVNAGAARFVEGGAITMGAADVIDSAQSAPATQVVAVHMEAINHCLLTRDELRRQLARMGQLAWVLVPEDGEEMAFS